MVNVKVRSCCKMPVVSVIIPTHNRAQFLYSAIASVLNQTYQDFEILVIDDNSKDNTQEVVKNFHDTRIKYIRHEKNKGEAGTRNTGIKHSNGRYIAFLDDDDEWLPEKLELQIDLLQNSPQEVGCIYTGFLTVDETKRKVLQRSIPSKRGYIYYDMFIRNYIGKPSTVMLKKECFKRIDLFDENIAFGTDYDMWIRISRDFHIDYIEKPMVLYCKHKNALSADLAVRNKGMEMLFKKHNRFFMLNRKGHGEFYMYLGIFYCCAGDVRKGRKALLKAITLYPFQIRSYCNLGLSFLNAGKFIKAREFRVRCYSLLRSLFHT
ncbi:MAG: glycosyltransferase [wastewater metagenome]|nr:glycosyltransferase [Candidatus Loosdrechtia aerotolerans]